MKLRLDYIILCESLIFDRSGRTSLINSYDTIFAETLPATHPKLLFVVRLVAQDVTRARSNQLRLSLKSPSGKEKIPKSESIEATFKPEQPSVVLSIEIPTVVFDEYGQYTAEIFDSTGIVASKKFEVKQGNIDDTTQS